MDTPFTRHLIPLTFDAAGVWLLVGVAFAVGSALGSFFNVVAYRVPRGMSLSHPGSRCPSCSRPIRWHDNVPIFGWLLLQGRCRDCKAPISARYPIVELLVALAMGLVAWKLVTPQANPELGDVVLLDLPQMAARALLVAALICAALLEFDGHRMPLPILIVALVVFAALAALDASEIGRDMAVAVFLGSLAWPALVPSAGRQVVQSAVAGVIELVMVSVVLGGWAVAAIAVLAISALMAMWILGRLRPTFARFGWAFWLVIGTLVWMVVPANASESWRVGNDLWTTLLAAGAIVAVLAIAARVAQRGPVRN